MTWKNLLDHPDFDLSQHAEGATSGGAGNTVYTEGQEYQPPNTSFEVSGGLVRIQSNNEGGELDGALFRLPADLAGKRVRLTFVEVDITRTKYSPMGSGYPAGGFSAFGCSLAEELSGWFQSESLNLFLGADSESSWDGKTAITTEVRGSELAIVGIDTVDGVMVRLDPDTVEPSGEGTLLAGQRLGVWFGTGQAGD